MIRSLLLYLYRHQNILLGITGALTATILFLTLLPSDNLTKTSLFKFDKIGHAIVFGGWTFLFGLVRFSYNRNQNYSRIIDLLAGIGFGVGIELLQQILPINRSADLFDLLADMLGILVAVYFLKRTHRILETEPGE